MFSVLGILSVISLLVIGFIYFIPSIIAQKRQHHNRNAIFVLNLFLGWSLIGWAISLSWALTRVESKFSPNLNLTRINY